MLNASGSFDPDNDTLYYYWDFGDSPGKAPVLGANRSEHRYTKPGRYIVTVNVSDGPGRLNSTAQQTVTVKQKGSEQFVIVIVVIIVLVVAIIFMLPRGDDRKAARLKAEDDEFKKGMAVRKPKSKKAKGPPPGSKEAAEEE
jgi:PKD repeat protein